MTQRLIEIDKNMSTLAELYDRTHDRYYLGLLVATESYRDDYKEWEARDAGVNT
jgi:hypothetical protein